MVQQKNSLVQVIGDKKYEQATKEINGCKN